MSPGPVMSPAERLLLYILLPTPLRATPGAGDLEGAAGTPVRDLEIASKSAEPDCAPTPTVPHASKPLLPRSRAATSPQFWQDVHSHPVPRQEDRDRRRAGDVSLWAAGSGNRLQAHPVMFVTAPNGH